MIEQPDFITTAIKMFSALLLVLGIFLGTFYLLRRVMKRDVADPGKKNIRVIDRNYIGVKKSVALVAVPGKVLVLGVTNDHISFLTQIDDPASIEQLKRTDRAGASTNFSSHFNRLLTKVRDGRSEKEASSVQAAID